MKFIAPILSLLALASAGCASQLAPSTRLPAPVLGVSARLVEVPTLPGEGQPREVRVLVDEPAVKLVVIILRRGTALPQHRSGVAVTIQATHGAGTVIAGTERLHIDQGHAVVLAPNVPHAVEPDGGGDLVLMVHHHGRSEEARP